MTVKTLQQLINDKVIRYHHHALHRGYVSVKATIIEEYNGRFGKGYKVLTNSSRSNQYHNVEYYIFNEEDKR